MAANAPEERGVGKKVLREKDSFDVQVLLLYPLKVLSVLQSREHLFYDFSANKTT